VARKRVETARLHLVGYPGTLASELGVLIFSMGS
jgi:hypothetical protein